MKNNKWLDSVIKNFLDKKQYHGNLTEKQEKAFCSSMELKNNQFYGRSYLTYYYETTINDKTVYFKIQNGKFYIDSDSITNEYENFKNNNEIKKIKDIIVSLENKIKNNPEDERTEKRKSMLNRKYKELEELKK